MDGRGSGQLARRLGLVDATVIGLGSMIGAGVFSAFAPAAEAAGSALLLGLVLAAVIAYCNAVASAQLAAVYPTSGGTYVYGRERLGDWWGFAAGWGFLVGKTASCAAMAMTFAAYAAPDRAGLQRLAGVVAVVGLAAVNYRGVTKTAALTKALVAGTLAALAVGVVAILTGPRDGGLEVAADAGSAGWYGVLQSAGLLFFAFAGYARIATMGEEVTEPERTIPRAVTLALATTVAVYGIVALAVLSAVGASELADSSAPVLAAVEASAGEAAGVVLRAGAVVATLGALLSLVAGVGRTSLAMARGGDLPSWLGAVHPRYHVPHHAEVALAAVVCLLVLTVDLRGAIGFSSFGVLVYYAIANASAFTQPAAVRRWPRAVFVLGLAGCVVLVATLPLASVAAGLAVFAVGLSGRWLLQRGRAGRPRSPG